MKKSDLERYDKYQIKEVNGIRQFDKDGAPVLDTKLRTATLSPQEAKFLNERASWYGVVYVKSDEKVEEEPKKETPKEPESDSVNLGDLTKEELVKIAKEKGLKSPHLMNKDTLIEKLK